MTLHGPAADLQRRLQRREWERWRRYLASPVIERWEDGEMSDVTVQAPANPYRRVMGMDEDTTLWRAGSPMMSYPAPPMRADTERGPGLTAHDIDVIARTHHHAGYAMAEREAEAKIEEMQARLADAYDAGYTAGRVERARGLANDIRGRLMGLHFALMQVERGPKTKAHDGLAAVREEFGQVEEFVEAIRGRPSVAAAQMVRDEI